MPIVDDINRVLRDFERYTGDGQPNEPVGHPPPIGDPRSGVHDLIKAELRALLVTLAQTMGDPSALEDILTLLGISSLVPLVNVAGTGDAITADLHPLAVASGVTVSSDTVAVIRVIEANTGPVTLHVSGDQPRNLLDNMGNSLPAGYLSLGRMLLVKRFLSGSSGVWRILNDINRNDAATLIAPLDAALGQEIDDRSSMIRLGSPTSPYSFAFLQRDGSGANRMTDLTLRASDGQFADFVVQRLRNRMGLINPGRPGLDGLWLHPSGDRVPYDLDRSAMVGLGSSSMNRSAAAYAAIAAGFGAAYINLGDEGATIGQNMAQIGARPAILTVAGGSIPASGPVDVTSSNMLINNQMMAFTGTLAGVHGTLAHKTGTTGTFTRTVGGASLAVPTPQAFLPDNRQYRANVMIIESGKNDINNGRAAVDVVADTVALAEWLAPFVPRTIVMGHYPNPAYNPAQMQAIVDVDDGLRETFGDRHISQLDWLVSPALWVDLASEGVTPTQDDLDAQAAGHVPPQLMADGGHLTSAAYGWRAKYLVRPRLIEIGIYQEV